jgi:hypothetical protein
VFAEALDGLDAIESSSMWSAESSRPAADQRVETMVHSMALTMSSTTFLASPNTISVLSM